MCILVKFYDKQVGLVVTSFWGLIPIFGEGTDYEAASHGATAELTYQIIIKTFEQEDIPLDNLIGFASDGCNVMMGQHNSVASRLIQNFPGITILKCVCHSLHLCASEACKMLPRRIEDLARNIYGFFKNSSKRQAELVEYQVFMETKIHKMLHPAQTRWLSLLTVVDRILEQYWSLKLFFTAKWFEERIVAAEMIYRDLSDPFTYMYFLFLQWVLPKFVKLNEYFQSRDPKITELDDRMRITYKELLCTFLDRNYVNQTPLHQIQPENSRYHIPSVYLGVKIMKEMEKEEIRNNREKLEEFREKTKLFLVTSCVQITKRYDFNNRLLPLLKYLSPEEAIKTSTRQHLPSILPIVTELPRILNNDDEIQIVDDEWRILPDVNRLSELKISEMKTDEFWHNIMTTTDCKHLAKFVLSILSLPHSNSDCERIFSVVNNIKTKKRNKLITSTINGLLLTKECVRNNGKGDCKKFVPTEEMFARLKDKKKYELSNKENDYLESISSLFG